MIQEEKSLLLKDLSARLPYGVMLDTPNGNKPLLALVSSKKYNTIVAYNYYHGNENDISEWEGGDVEFIKPYLRPISSMTEEEFVYFMGLRGRMLQSYEIQSMMKEAFNMPNSITIVTQLYNYLHKMDWLLSKHFDVRGLIPKDLAIAVTEENNPYKE